MVQRTSTATRQERGLAVVRWMLVATAVVVAVLGVYGWGGLGRGAPPEAPREIVAPEARLALAEQLAADVEHLALAVGSRHLRRPDALADAADWIATALTGSGWQVERHGYRVGAQDVENLAVTLPGTQRPDEIVVVGAHYDTVPGCPGANDNASGVAVGLALARAYQGRQVGRTLRLLFFTNEEPPHFQSETMGSLVYARACAERGETIVAVLSLDSVGYYSDAPDSQHLPSAVAFLFPDEGNFLAVAGNLESKSLVDRVASSMRSVTELPIESGALPGNFPGVGWSDHWSFWQCGYPGVVVTDTAIYRDPQYHRPGDRPGRLDPERLAQVVRGMTAAVDDLLLVVEEEG